MNAMLIGFRYDEECLKIVNSLLPAQQKIEEINKYLAMKSESFKYEDVEREKLLRFHEWLFKRGDFIMGGPSVVDEYLKFISSQQPSYNIHGDVITEKDVYGQTQDK